MASIRGDTMRIHSRSAVVGVACATLISVWTAAASAQVARTELHAIPTLTLSDQQFLTDDKNGIAVTIAGVLRLPSAATDRLPAVILLHGSGGIGGNVDRWSQELNGIGMATFVTESFTARGIQSTSADQALLGRLNMMFAAYLPFYPPCFTTYIGDEDVSDKPIRIFHGAADDYVPVAPCRSYVERLRKAGKDVTLTEYPDANHAFDNPLTKVTLAPRSQTTRRCTIKEEPAGVIINAVTKQPFTMQDPCVERGPHVGYNAAATTAATHAVKEFLQATLKLN